MNEAEKSGARVPVEDGPAGAFVHLAEGVVPREAVLPPFERLVHLEGDTALQGRREWTGNVAMSGDALVISTAQGQLRLGSVGRLVGNEIDQAARRVTAIQGPLRPLQDFDLRHVEYAA